MLPKSRSVSIPGYLTCAALAMLIGLPALAGEASISIEDAYARGGPHSGAAFFTIANAGQDDDRLVGVSSDSAERVELHTHLEDENGVIRMRPVEDGFQVPAGGTHALERGGDHVMFMGLAAPFEDGGTVAVTLSFEKAGDMELQIPVDNDRGQGHGGSGD